MADTGAGGYRRHVDGVEYEWRQGPSGLGWYNDEHQWFLTHDEANRRSGVASTSGDENVWGMLAHLLAIFTGFIGPLVIYLVKTDSPRARANAAEALNFTITVMLAYLAALVLVLIVIGVLLFVVIGIGSVILQIIGAVKANQGEVYRYPVNIRFVRG